MTKPAYLLVDAKSSRPEMMAEYRRLAQSFYDSPEYVAARKARDGVSDFDMLLAEAY